MRKILSFASVLAVMLLGAVSASAATVTLAWDPSSDQRVVGYQLQIGSASGRYDVASLDVGAATTWTVPNLLAGQSYYFTVRAYTTDRLYSANANEVSFSVPVVRQTGRLTYDPTSGIWSSPLHDQFGATPANQPGWTVMTGDFNGDGFQDMFMYNPTTGAWLKAIDQREGNYAFFGYSWASGWSPTVADFDGDGKSDVFIYNRTSGQWFMCRSLTGTNEFAYLSGKWAPGWTIQTGDFNGDRRADLFLFNSRAPGSDANSGKWFRVLTQADGSFQYIAGDVTWATDWQITTADFDGDGRSDLFLYRPGGQWFKVFFTPTSAAYVGGLWGGGWTIRATDFDADGRTDLFLYNATSGRWLVSLSQADGSFAFYEGRWAANWQVTPTDFNADRRGDLLLYNPSTGIWFEATTLAPGVFGYLSGTGASSSTLTVVR